MSSAPSVVTYTSVYTDSEPGRVFWGANEELSDGGSLRVIVYGYDGLPMQLVAPPSPDYIPGPEEPQTLQAPQDEDEQAEVEILLAMPTPPPSPLTSLSPPSAGERLARMASTQALIDAVTAALPSPPPLPPPLYIPPSVDYRDDVPKTEMPPRKRLCLSTIGSRYEVRENSTARLTGGQGIDYEFVSTGSDWLGVRPYLDDVPKTEMPPRKRLCLSTIGSRYEVRESSTARLTGGQGIDYEFVSTDFSDSNDEFSSTDDDSFSIDNIKYVEASPLDSELASSEVMEIVIPEVGGIDDDILLTIKDDILREKLLNINLLIAKIKALNDNPTPSLDFMTKSYSTSFNSLLEETNSFDNSLPEFETFCFDVEEISSDSTTTRSDISLPQYEVFYDDHVKEISSENQSVTELAELHEHDTQDLYALLEDAQDSRTGISQRFTMDSQRVDLLMEDRIAHQETILIVKEEAYVAREAWAHSIGLSQAFHSELQTHREQVYTHEFHLHTSDASTITGYSYLGTTPVMGDMRREMGDMQAELLALRERPRRARQPGSDARVPDHQDAPRDTNSHI
nr:hypothetical protein [Tanacetum cinerariifolium]